jgi:hypothetical protein
MNWQQMVQKRGAARRREERVKGMKAEHWSAIRVVGIAPFTIDRVEGTYLVEFDRTGCGGGLRPAAPGRKDGAL